MTRPRRKPPIYTPEAKLDIRDTADWFERTYSHDVALQFLRMVRKLVTHITRYPEAHEVVYQDVRMAVSQELSYSVFYTYEAGQVTVFAVMHQRRDPGDWQIRVKK